MTDKPIKKYCNGLCTVCDKFGIYDEEPCIYKIANELEKKLLCKEQECKKLREELEAVYDDCKGCPTCNEALYNANLYAKEYRKLKQTLIEIKEIAETCSTTPCSRCKFTDVCTTMNMGLILQKISEVENEK